MSSIYDRLTDLDISLPPLAIPAGAYVPFVRSGNLVFLSGHIAKRDGKVWVGQLGRDMTTAPARRRRAPSPSTCSARCTPPSATSTRSSASSASRASSTAARLHRAPPGDNGCSELLGEVFAERARMRAAPTASPSCRSAPASRSS